jgi:hypothetical protein
MIRLASLALSLGFVSTLSAQGARPADSLPARISTDSGTFSGVAFDSLRLRPLGGVLVQLVDGAGRVRSAVADSAGAFLFAALPDGAYVVDWLAMPGDTLPHWSAPQSLSISPVLRAPRAWIGLPSATSLRLQFCGAGAAERLIDLTLIEVRDAGTNTLRTDATVTLTEAGDSLRSAPTPMPMPGAARVAGAGRAAFCTLATDPPRRLVIEHDGRAVELPRAPHASRLFARIVRVAASSDSSTSTSLSGEVRTASGPVRGAQVTTWSDAPPQRTDSAGRFRLRLPTAGTHAVRVTAVGYAPQLQLVDLPRETPLVVQLAEAPRTLLPAVRVAGRRSFAGFEARRARGRGAFLDSAQIVAMAPMHAGEAVRQVPGVRVIPTRGFSPRILLRASRGYCAPNLFIDGVDRDTMSTDLDGMVDLTAIVAIEVYLRVEDVPPEFPVPLVPACGAIVIWTRSSKVGGG